MNTNLLKKLVFNKQADKRKKRQTGSEKGRHFSQGLMSFPYMNTNLTKRLVFNKQERGKCFTGSYVLSLYEYKVSQGDLYSTSK